MIFTKKIKEGWEKWGTLTPRNARYDRGLIWLFFSLLMIGFIMVTSASIPVSTRLYNDPFYFTLRDALYVAVAIIMFFTFIQIPSEQWEKWNLKLFAISLLLLLLVLIIGRNVNGSTRWIPIGPINFQPAELAKLALICYFSSFYVRKFDEIRIAGWSFFRPVLVMILFGVFLVLQPDLGSTAVLFIITFAMLFFVGAKLLQFLVLGILGGFAFMILVLTSEYRLKRVTSFMDPFADAYGDGFQLSNAQMAFGQGEFWGAGLGNSIQKLEYLPEAHTDFVMAVIGEEFGLFGISIVILLLTALTLKAFYISRQALNLEQRFKGFFAFGIGVWIFLQGFVNLGVASGLLPTKGLTFPLVSYGGSSLVIMAVAVAILVRIDYENRLENAGQATLKEYE
ncbi:cell division-specific peptidoglycan biosynthesis regulator FtsW [Vespertiliibacter pulmonis]|uniref:Probable peptidoglycan glycosyltransferase FtsW n=1 Tax=Vespertiliibacter pulmonis TaxID=1443036 RepID=A0A3N4VTG3_9PAST|nr:putative lipid II flippase FtsW [Vespertiliibacter pulmonis]RPE86412.1 cell division-specific peptidoglycan biosynthesis regulator FtsW [Vespertiliibacter pulmonis]